MLISLGARFLFSQAGNMHIRPYDIAFRSVRSTKGGVPDSPHHRGGEVERRSPPAEEAEFELARARGRVALFLRRRRGRRSIRVVSKDAGPFHGGTGGSNPLRSRGESVFEPTDPGIDEQTAAMGSIRLGLLPHTLPTRTLTGQRIMSSGGRGKLSTCLSSAACSRGRALSLLSLPCSKAGDRRSGRAGWADR